ncbi:MAG: flavin reductase family protein [Alphaproteobacteria bacterium]|nr:flavin reductase family protein [Alphaproteobacteria bacterium]
MTKVAWRPGTMLSPLPPALVTSGDKNHNNVMTAAWTGIICSDPVITYVSIRPSRYTHTLISQNKEFVINIPTWKIASAVDTVGVKSGRDIDKFALTGLTPEPCQKIKAPQIAECPISIECKVIEIRPFGTHDMFLAEVVSVNIDDKYINEDGALDLEKAGLLAYAHGFYYTLGRRIGKFGFSVEKKKKNAIKNQALPKNSTTGTIKFTQKTHKRTNYEPYSFKKKSDGSFKKKMINKK